MTLVHILLLSILLFHGGVELANAQIGVCAEDCESQGMWRYCDNGQCACAKGTHALATNTQQCTLDPKMSASCLGVLEECSGNGVCAAIKGNVYCECSPGFTGDICKDEESALSGTVGIAVGASLGAIVVIVLVGVGGFMLMRKINADLAGDSSMDERGDRRSRSARGLRTSDRDMKRKPSRRHSHKDMRDQSRSAVSRSRSVKKIETHGDRSGQSGTHTPQVSAAAAAGGTVGGSAYMQRPSAQYANQQYAGAGYQQQQYGGSTFGGGSTYGGGSMQSYNTVYQQGGGYY